MLRLAAACLTLAVTGAPAAAPWVAARIPTGFAPCGAAVGFGGLWVANDRSGTIVRIDTRRNRVDRRIAVGRGACRVAAGAGAIWIARYRPNELVRVDPRDGSVRRVAVGGWVDDVAVAGGSIWVTAHEERTVTRLDPATLERVATIRLGGHPAGLAVRGGVVWVGGGGRDTWLSTIDPATERVHRIEVGVEAPSWFARGTEDVWATTAERSIVRVLDAGPGAYTVRAAFGSLWVTSYAGSDVWRFALR